MLTLKHIIRYIAVIEINVRNMARGTDFSAFTVSDETQPEHSRNEKPASASIKTEDTFCTKLPLPMVLLVCNAFEIDQCFEVKTRKTKETTMANFIIVNAIEILETFLTDRQFKAVVDPNKLMIISGPNQIGLVALANRLVLRRLTRPLAMQAKPAIRVAQNNQPVRKPIISPIFGISRLSA